MGTDLTYHDVDLSTEMATWSEEDATSRLVGTEPVGSVPCHVIELTPRREDIGYKRIVLWLASDDLVARQIELRGADSEAVKRVQQSEVETVDKIPVARRASIETPKADTRTDIALLDVRFNQHLPDDLFSQRSLERGKE